MAHDLTIGVLAAQSRCNVPTIRFYEEIGLLPHASRKASGHRIYGDRDLRRLLFIRRCRDFGFPIEQVRELVALTDDGSRECTEARDMVQLHLNAVRDKLAELKALEQSLVEFVASCDTRCAGGPTSNCAILDELAATKPQTS